ncbi:hypothetical protein PI124_g18719, partial [Phytophthora idaei]
MEEDAEENPLH